MDAQIFDWIDTLIAWHAVEVLVGFGTLLVLVDYFFPTDVPAHFGYVCLAAAMFFVAYMAGLAPATSALVCLGVWGLLAVLHRVWWGKLLENAPDSSEA